MNFLLRRGRILFLAVILAMIPNYAQSDGDFEILQNANNTVTITKYKGSATNVAIPSVLYGIKVIGIGGTAFAFQSKSITSVVFPNTLISIGASAFYGNELGEIVIPNSVTHIEKEAFKKSGVTKVSFGNGVKSIGSDAFADNKIKEVILPPSLTSVESSVFYHNEIENVSFGNNIKEIKEKAFAYNHIQSITIPMGVTIGNGAFECNQLTSVTIPNGVTAVSSIFRNNPINTLVIPTSLTIRWEQAFVNLPLTRITMPANKDNSFLDMSGFEKSFINFYVNQNRAAKTYFKNGPIWTLTAPEPKTEAMFTDSRNGMLYKTVNINGKIWMAANLSYKPQTGKSGCYDNNPDNCRIYGGLYDWNTALKVCPEGWHLPSRQEWEELVTAAGGVARKLKAISGWDYCAGGGDDFGFSALPGGERNGYNGDFNSVGGIGYWWTATESESGNAYYRRMSGSYDGVNDIQDHDNKSNGYSVRCVQDG